MSVHIRHIYCEQGSLSIRFLYNEYMHRRPINLEYFFFFGESFVLLTAKRIVLAVIDVETYGPNFWKWFDGLRLRIALPIPEMQIH